MPSKKINVDYSNMKSFINENELTEIQKRVTIAHKMLSEKTGPGSDYLGWLDLPYQNQQAINEISETADEIKQNADAIVCIGIGGSYLGAKAVIEAIQPERGVAVYYAGNHIDSDYLSQLMKKLENKEFYINVISKSGTTLEPSLSFRILKRFMQSKYGNEKSARRIIATTDKSRGLLKTYADAEGFRTFAIPDDVGGRFSVLTPVGLLPIAASGVDIYELLGGAREMAESSADSDITKNESYLYAALRYLAYKKGKRIEILANFKPALHYISEWWKQLYGESEGKENKGLFPSSVNFTTDLHSLGQYIQEGVRNIIETFLIVEKSKNTIHVKKESDNQDGLNYLSDKDMDEINHKAYLGTSAAHLDGDVPNMTITIPSLTPQTIGHLLFFFEKAVAISGYLLDVNPFNQPGVEAYKKNMFKLLGRPE